MQWNEVPARCLDVTSLVLLHFVLIEYLLGFINPLLHVAFIIQFHPSSSISWDFHFYQRIENVRTMLQSSSEFILFRFSLTWSLSRDYFWILGFIFFFLQFYKWFADLEAAMKSEVTLVFYYFSESFPLVVNSFDAINVLISFFRQKRNISIMWGL